MHTVKLNIQDSVFDKVIDFLKNLPSDVIEIIEEKSIVNDWSYLESEVDIGLASGINDKSQEEIAEGIKNRYHSSIHQFINSSTHSLNNPSTQYAKISNDIDKEDFLCAR